MAKETVAIVDYGSGNLHSAAKAFERMAAAAGGRQAVVVSSDPDVVRTAGRIVLPGVGAFADCRAGLLAVDGMMAALTEAVIDGGQPFLGICVGMQLMASVGLEHGRHEGFGWIPGQVEAIRPINGLKLPHMGWNDLSPTAHPVLAGIAPRRNAYFVHSYHLRCDDPNHIQAQVDYGDTITAAVGRDNLFGTQFHPEKSLETGMRLIANFLAWRP